ncbi:hypothetical protein QN277_010365 [Acacia crassicarpa]|uniref:Uncharacterized protein n=1 Tax=Acacia crassicarpa TaxID=499986 RepID=A0AAE1INW5_9FABA|nr:hypothetical protein QN277_010365 [Acacia crassicarpa]
MKNGRGVAKIHQQHYQACPKNSKEKSLVNMVGQKSLVKKNLRFVISRNRNVGQNLTNCAIKTISKIHKVETKYYEGLTHDDLIKE